jgi:DNA-binding CsgD family transcriptional regulator
LAIIARVQGGPRLVRVLAVAAVVCYVTLLAIGWSFNARAGYDGILRPAPHDIGSGSGFTVLEVEPGGPADRAGVRRGDVVVAVDGNPAVFDMHQTYHNRRAGAPGMLRFSSDGRPPAVASFALQSRLASPSLLLGLVFSSALGMAIVAVGACVAFVRPDTPAAGLLLVFALALAIYANSDVWHWTTRSAAGADLLDELAATAMLLGAAALLHLFLIFPAPGRLYGRVRRFVPGLYVAALVPLAITLLPGGSGAAWGLSVLLLVACLLAAVLALELSFRRPTTPLARAQLAWIRWGLGVGVGATVLHGVAALLVPEAVPAITSTLVAAAWLVFPISLALAVLRFRLFEVDRIVRATIIWGLLAAVLLAGYLVLVAIVGRLAASVFGPSISSGDDPTVAVVAVLVVAAVAHPLRVRLMAALERRIYHHRLGRQRLVDQATELLSQPQRPHVVARFLCQQVPRALGLRSGWLALAADQVVLFEVDPGVLLPGVSVASATLLDALRNVDGPLLLVSAEDLEAHRALDALASDTPGTVPWYAAGGRILVGLRNSTGGLLAVWVLGAPTSGDLLERDDLAALNRIGTTASMQLERERAGVVSPGPRGGEPVRELPADLLTPRELEVMALLKRGYSNRQIADELIIGVRTAETHVQRILRKLDLDTRVQAMLWARDEAPETRHP